MFWTGEKMRRRDFITMVGGMTAWSRAARAAQADRARLIGVLMGYAENDPAAHSDVAAFRGALASLGWMEGSNIWMELRWGAGDVDKTKTVAKGLVDLRPDAILGHTTPVIGALARETRTIPIVFANLRDLITSR
jgi:putative tryptophan/tyrosine transport system substrate-binding protein